MGRCFEVVWFQCGTGRYIGNLKYNAFNADEACVRAVLCAKYVSGLFGRKLSVRIPLFLHL